ncbi:MAG: hypothetical protein ACPGWR_24000, partial [Ardenticatenaceae bacterium]
ANLAVVLANLAQYEANLAVVLANLAVVLANLAQNDGKRGLVARSPSGALRRHYVRVIAI